LDLIYSGKLGVLEVCGTVLAAERDGKKSSKRLQKTIEAKPVLHELRELTGRFEMIGDFFSALPVTKSLLP